MNGARAWPKTHWANFQLQRRAALISLVLALSGWRSKIRLVVTLVIVEFEPEDDVEGKTHRCQEPQPKEQRRTRGLCGVSQICTPSSHAFLARALPLVLVQLASEGKVGARKALISLLTEHRHEALTEPLSPQYTHQNATKIPAPVAQQTRQYSRTDTASLYWRAAASP